MTEPAEILNPDSPPERTGADLALDLAQDGIALLRRRAGDTWDEVVSVALDSEDFEDAMKALAVEVKLHGDDARVDLILPSDQVRVVSAKVAGRAVSRRAARRALQDKTPYSVWDLSYDVGRLRGGIARVLATKRQTVQEAREFARGWDIPVNRVTARCDPLDFPDGPDLKLGADYRALAAMGRSAGIGVAALLAGGLAFWQLDPLSLRALPPEINDAPPARLAAVSLGAGGAFAAVTARGADARPDFAQGPATGSAPAPRTPGFTALTRTSAEPAGATGPGPALDPRFVDAAVARADAPAALARIARRAVFPRIVLNVVEHPEALVDHFGAPEGVLRRLARLSRPALGGARPAPNIRLGAAGGGVEWRAPSDISVEGRITDNPAPPEVAAVEFLPLRPPAAEAGAVSVSALDPVAALRVETGEPVETAQEDAPEAPVVLARLTSPDTSATEMLLGPGDTVVGEPEPSHAPAPAEPTPAPADDDAGVATPSDPDAPVAAREPDENYLPPASPHAVATAPPPLLKPRTEKELVEAEDGAPTRFAAQTAPAPDLRPQGIRRQAIALAKLREKEREAAKKRAAALPPNEVAPKVVARKQQPRTAGSVAARATIRDALDLGATSLLGVFGKAGSRRALVRLPNGEIRRVRNGDSVDGWKVAAIGQNSLRLNRSGQKQTLRVPGS